MREELRGQVRPLATFLPVSPRLRQPMNAAGAEKNRIVSGIEAR
jgi:hypothetical protein